MRDWGADGVLEGPILKEDGMHVKYGIRTEVNLRPVEMVSAFCKISERCKLCTEKNFKLYTGNGPVEVTF